MNSPSTVEAIPEGVESVAVTLGRSKSRSFRDQRHIQRLTERVEPTLLMAALGRVEDWRRSSIGPVYLFAPCFLWECLTNRTVNWFSVPAASPLLDIEDPERQARASGGPTRGSRPHPPHEQRKPGLGSVTHRRRAAEARHKYRGDQREQVSHPEPPAAVPKVANFSRQSSEAPCVHTLLHRADHPVSGPLRLPCSGARAAAYPSLRCHRTPDCRVDCTAAPGSFSMGHPAPRYLLRDRDRIFGHDFVEQVKAMGIKQVLSAPRSPWQRACIERVVGTIRRECLDHIVVFNESSLFRP